jgi:monoamine oxidase
MAVENGGQAMKVVEGTAEISARIAQHLKSNVRQSHAVREIDYSDPTCIKVIAECTESGQRSLFTCKQLVIALAPSLYRTIIFRPHLPPSKAQLSEHMPMVNTHVPQISVSRPQLLLLDRDPSLRRICITVNLIGEIMDSLVNVSVH